MSTLSPSPAMESSPQSCAHRALTSRFHDAAPASLLAAIAAVLFAAAAQAEIIAPYAPDEHTLHLWHLDEATPPVADAAVGGIPLHQLEHGATLENESYRSTKSFGGALGTYIGNPAMPPGCTGQGTGLAAQLLQNGPGDNVPLRYAGASGAFTYEAVVRVDFNPAINLGADGWGQGRNHFMQVISGDADENADRVFQFRLAPIGTLNGNAQPLLEFINLNQGNQIQSLTAAIPTTGQDAIVTGNWYHLAVAYNGQPDQPDNLKFYWTLVRPERAAANLVGSGQMTRSLPTGCNPDFALGQTGRQSPVTPIPNNNFVGLIDEVRISGVARAATQMLFGGGALVEHPASPAQGPAPAAENTASPPAPAAVAGNATAPEAQPAHVPTPVVATAPSNAGEPATIASGAIIRGPASKPRLAVMFSCRDADESVAVILDALKTHQAKASFFVTSEFLVRPANRVLTVALVAQGHYVGPQADNWLQLDFARAGVPSRPDVEAHLRQLEAVGVSRKQARFFLPTSDQLTPAAAARARAVGLIMVAGTSGTLSFATTTAEGTDEFISSQAILDSILRAERQGGLNGYLLLFPLEHGSRRKDKFQARFGELLGTLRARGYELVRVDQLLEGAAGVRSPSLVDLKRP